MLRDLTRTNPTLRVASDHLLAVGAPAGPKGLLDTRGRHSASPSSDEEADAERPQADPYRNDGEQHREEGQGEPNYARRHRRQTSGRGGEGGVDNHGSPEC